MTQHPISSAIIAVLAGLTVLVSSVSGQTSKRSIDICGSEVGIGYTRQAVAELYSKFGNACKLMDIDANSYAVMTTAKEPDQLGYIKFENGKVSELERSIRVEGDSNAAQFTIFHLLEDFKKSSNSSCVITNFENKESWVTSSGVQLDCGSRSLKLVNMDFQDGKRTIELSEILRK